MKDNPIIKELFFERNRMILFFHEYEITFMLSDFSAKPLNASDIERSIYKIFPSGYGIHCPLLDADISVNELMKKHE